jgi:hypothetical protein
MPNHTLRFNPLEATEQYKEKNTDEMLIELAELYRYLKGGEVYLRKRGLTVEHINERKSVLLRKIIGKVYGSSESDIIVVQLSSTLAEVDFVTLKRFIIMSVSHNSYRNTTRVSQILMILKWLTDRLERYESSTDERDRLTTIQRTQNELAEFMRDWVRLPYDNTDNS